MTDDKASKHEPSVSQNSHPTVQTLHRPPSDLAPASEDQALPPESQSSKGYFTHACLADLESQALAMQKKGTFIVMDPFPVTRSCPHVPPLDKRLAFIKERLESFNMPLQESER